MEMAALTLFGLTVLAVCADPDFVSRPRDLHVVEIFAGVGSVVLAARQAGLQAVAFDKSRVLGRTDDPEGPTCEDLTTRRGFLNAVGLVIRLRVGGLLWLAPACASWVWLNLSNTRRSVANDYYGDMRYPPVADGNLLAEISAFLIELAARRLVAASVENPVNSLIWKFPPMSAVLSRFGMVSSLCYRCAYDCSPEPRISKVYKFFATGSWILGTRKACTCNGEHLRLTKRWQNAQGHRKYDGTKVRLAESASYPAALGAAIVRCWLSSAESGVQTTREVPSPEILAARVGASKRLAAADWHQPAMDHRKRRRGSEERRLKPNAQSWLQPAIASPRITRAMGGLRGAAIDRKRSWIQPSVD